MTTMRAFLSVEPDDALRRQIADVIQELRACIDPEARRVRVTWVRPEAIHLTVRFFGDIDEQFSIPLREAVLGVMAGERTSGVLPLTHIDAFPRTQAPRALWIGPPADWQKTDDGIRLSSLVRKVDDACSRVCGERDEQLWRPHLTLARVRAGERDVGRLLAASGFFERPLGVDALRVNEISFIKSELRPAGPVHTRLWTVAF